MPDKFLDGHSLSYLLNTNRSGIFSVSLVQVLEVIKETKTAHVAFGPRFSGRTHVPFDQLASSADKLMPKIAFALAGLDLDAMRYFESLPGSDGSAVNQMAGDPGK